MAAPTIFAMYCSWPTILALLFTHRIVPAEDIGDAADTVAEVGFERFPRESAEEAKEECSEWDIGGAEAVVDEGIGQNEVKAKKQGDLAALLLDCPIDCLECLVSLIVSLHHRIQQISTQEKCHHGPSQLSQRTQQSRHQQSHHHAIHFRIYDACG